MNAIQFFTFLSITLIFRPAFTGESIVKFSNDCRCEKLLPDRFEEAMAFNFGVYSDQCIDSCKYRRAVILRTGQPISSIRQNWVIANVLHNNKYWIANIPVNEVDYISINFEKFSAGISHVFLRFHFSKKIILQSQSTLKTKPEVLNDICISAEGITPKNQTYNFLDAALEHYILGIRVVSLSEFVDFMIKKQNHSVSQYRLKLSSNQKIDVLTQALKTSSEKSFKSKYQLVKNNCATNSMDLIERATNLVGKNDHLFSEFYRGLPIDLSFSTLTQLLELGLIDNTIQMPNLEAEINLPQNDFILFKSNKDR